jgi:RNA polymerase sigma-70 factor (ECF subfamily)
MLRPALVGEPADVELQALGRRAFAVAYRMLGSVVEAEDVAQEALLRLTGVEGDLEEPAAWITTVATRLSIDHLRLARVRREGYVGPWLPEPLVVDAAPGPADLAELADDVSQALLVALEQLTPLERAAFVLHEVFDYDYARIAQVVERSEASCRQLVSRAKRHLDDRPRFDADPAHGQALLERFLAAAEGGDLAALEEMLAEDVVLYGDGGGKVKAATQPVAGAAAVARFLIDIARARRALGEFDLQLVTVNGQPGRVLRDADRRVWDVLAIDVTGGRIGAVRIVRNPDKLRHL